MYYPWLDLCSNFRRQATSTEHRLTIKIVSFLKAYRSSEHLEMTAYWWCDFRNNPHVRLLVGGYIGHSFIKGKGSCTSMLISEPLFCLILLIFHDT